MLIDDSRPRTGAYSAGSQDVVMMKMGNGMCHGTEYIRLRNERERRDGHSGTSMALLKSSEVYTGGRISEWESGNATEAASWSG